MKTPFSSVLQILMKSAQISQQINSISTIYLYVLGIYEAPKRMKIKRIVLKDPIELNETILIEFIAKSLKFEKPNKEIVDIRVLISKMHYELENIVKKS